MGFRHAIDYVKHRKQSRQCKHPGTGRMGLSFKVTDSQQGQRQNGDDLGRGRPFRRPPEPGRQLRLLAGRAGFSMRGESRVLRDATGPTMSGG